MYYLLLKIFEHLLFAYEVETQAAKTLYESPLEFDFIRECMKINKIRS